MRSVAFLLTCVACSSHGRRVQFDHARFPSAGEKSFKPKRSLRNFLLSIQPAVAWQHSHSRFGDARTRQSIRTSPLSASATDGPLPKLVVLDLDMCVWSPEMYTLDEMPDRPIQGDLNGRGEGVIGVRSGGDVIRLFPGALAALQEVADGKYEGMLLAVASSADTPLAEKIGRSAMAMLEVLPGLTLKELLMRGFDDGRNLQIGRQPPLSSNKARTHFPILKEKTGIPYDQMLFFDDSLWGDHCGQVEAECPGVVTQRTPTGLQEVEWRNALRKFAQASSE